MGRQPALLGAGARWAVWLQHTWWHHSRVGCTRHAATAQVGINAWRALRDTAQPHAAWRHLKGQALTEDALPRGIEAFTGAHDRWWACSAVRSWWGTGAPRGLLLLLVRHEMCRAPVGACAGVLKKGDVDDHGHAAL